LYVAEVGIDPMKLMAGAAAISRFNCVLAVKAVALPESVMVKVGVAVPAQLAVTVPDSNPVVGLSVRHAGKPVAVHL
jgi:hypothetical protein